MARGIGDVRRITETPVTAGPRRLSAGRPWGPHPAVLHVDIDAFFASVEQLRNPHLRGRPVIVGTGVVASASYEARAFGIRAGTTLRDVRRRCPQAVILPGHAPTYRAFAERLFDLAAELSPDVETFLDDAFVDLSGTEALHGHLIRAAAHLRRRVREATGLTVSLGLGTNRMVARMVTRLSKPDGFSWLRPGGEADFVASRPVEELPGIGWQRAGVLREMGVTRVGELRDFSSLQLRDLFGEAGLLIAERARGRETRAIHAAELPRSIRRETSFEQPQIARSQLDAMLHYLAERATGQARRLGVEPCRLRVHLRWADGMPAARTARLCTRGCPTEALFAAARALLRGLLTRRMGIRNLGIQISRFHLEASAQMGLFATAPAESPAPLAAGGSDLARQRQLDAAVDEVRARFGFRSLLRGPSLELLGQLPSDAYGFILRTPCLTR